MPRVFIALGSNLGIRENHLKQAVRQLEILPASQLIRVSNYYETDAVGGPPQGKYLNAVAEMKTELHPAELLKQLLEIEQDLGRIRSEKNAPRTIDLDIIAYGDEIIDNAGVTGRSPLHIPHPRMHEREFVLRPMSDLAPDWKHPVLKKTVKELLNEITKNHLPETKT